MTCIVGVETKNGVIISGDSASVAGYDISQTRLKKVFTCGKDSEFLIGYTYSFRMAQLIQYKLDVETQEKKQADLEYLATTFIDGVKKCLIDGGFNRKKDAEDEGGQFLVGYKGKIYKVDTDYQVNSSMSGYNGVGCGSEYAKGSMFSTHHLPPKQRVKMAMKAAAKHCSGVCKPFTIVKGLK